MQYCVTDGVKDRIRYTQVTQQHDEEPTNTTSKREKEREISAVLAVSRVLAATCGRPVGGSQLLYSLGHVGGHGQL